MNGYDAESMASADCMRRPLCELSVVRRENRGEEVVLT